MRDKNIDPEKLSKQITALIDDAGVPQHFVRGIQPIHTGLLRDVVTPDKEFVVSKVSQLRIFKEMCRNSEDNLCVFAGDRFPTFARFAAILMLAERIRLGQLNAAGVRWELLTYGPRQYGLDERFPTWPDVLVLDAVYENSTAITVEKVRAFISQYDPPTVIVIGAGACPSVLAHKVVHIDPTRWLRFA